MDILVTRVRFWVTADFNHQPRIVVWSWAALHTEKFMQLILTVHVLACIFPVTAHAGRCPENLRRFQVTFSALVENIWLILEPFDAFQFSFIRHGLIEQVVSNGIRLRACCYTVSQVGYHHCNRRHLRHLDKIHEIGSSSTGPAEHVEINDWHL